MTSEETKASILEGQKWFFQIYEQSRKSVQESIPPYFKRRAAQLKCNELFYGWNTKSPILCFLKYGASLLYIDYLIIKSIFNRKKIDRFSIWDSEFEKHLTQNQILTFFKQGPLFKSGWTFLFIKNTPASVTLEDHQFLKKPLFEVLQSIRFSFLDIFILKHRLLINFVRLLKISFISPLYAQAWKDFASEPLIQLYQKRGLQKFFRTNSDFNTQEFWANKIDFNTICYSVNSINFQYKCLDEKVLEVPLYYFTHFGTSWTWNRRHADWLNNNFGADKTHIVGPIMFYLPSSLKNQTPKARKRLLLFDVTPFEDKIIRDRVYRIGYNYYSEENCLKFLNDVVPIFVNLNWDVYLKPKRPYSHEHSAKYLQLIKNYVDKGQLKTLPANSNNFDEISVADLIISVPFSSPFDIAHTLNKKALYYDAAQIIDFKKMGFNEQDYSNSPEALKIWAQKISGLT